MKKFIAAVMALCIVGGSLPAVYSVAPECAVTAFAETDVNGEEYEEVTEGFLTYDVYDDHAEVVSCDKNVTGEIVISDKINGVPVTSIGDSAFSECISLKTITIPDNVKTIKGWTFSMCSNLESITIPDSVTSIGKCAFFICEKLKSITIPNSVTSIGDSAFYNCQSLQSITIPDTLTRICYETFSGCSSLESITIPDSVTDIINFAFAYCENVKSIEVPDSVTSIGNWSFNCCSSLESITILNPDCEIFDSKEVICNGYNENRDPYFNGTIRGYEGSTAQAYAEKYGYKFEPIEEICTAIPIQIVPGDANGDGGIDMSDVVMVMQAYLNPKKYGVNGTSPDRITAEGEKAGDVDGKAGLTANDALVIQRFSLKLIDSFDEPAANS